MLDQIDQMAMELHGVNEQRFIDVVRLLKRKFYLVNLHFNNSSCTRKSYPLPAWAYQVLWVNKRIGILDETTPTPAPVSPLNAPDFAEGPDCQLPLRSDLVDDERTRRARQFLSSLDVLTPCLLESSGTENIIHR